jgi:hypothetical protein
MPDLDELVLTEPRGPDDDGLAASRTLRGDVSACLEGFHWVAYAARSDRVHDTSGWHAHAALDGEIIARGTVVGVRIDGRTEVATLDVEPPERVFPSPERAGGTPRFR